MCTKDSPQPQLIHYSLYLIYKSIDYAIDRTGPFFHLLLWVSTDYSLPIIGKVTEVTCPVIGWAQPELTPSKRQKNGQLRLCSANHRPGYWSNMPCDWLSTAWAYSKFCVLDHSVLLCCSKIITPKIPVRPWPICHLWSTLKPTMIDAAYCSGHIAIRSLSEDINHCKLHISGLIDLLTYKSKHSILSSNIVKAKKLVYTFVKHWKNEKSKLIKYFLLSKYRK